MFNESFMHDFFGMRPAKSAKDAPATSAGGTVRPTNSFSIRPSLEPDGTPSYGLFLNQYYGVLGTSTLGIAKNKDREVLWKAYEHIASNYPGATPPSVPDECEVSGYIYRNGEMICSNCGRPAKESAAQRPVE